MNQPSWVEMIHAQAVMYRSVWKGALPYTKSTCPQEEKAEADSGHIFDMTGGSEGKVVMNRKS